MARRWITTDSADPRLPDDVIQATSVTGVTGHDLVDVDPADPRLPDVVADASLPFKVIWPSGGDDTTMINAAAAALPVGGTLWFTPGVYPTSGTVELIDINVMMPLDSYIEYTGTGTAVTVQSTGSNVIRQTVRAQRSVTEWDVGTDTTSEGIVVYNTNRAKLDLAAFFFHRGVIFRGDGVGCVDNESHVVAVNNKKNLSTDIIGAGYVNENYFTGMLRVNSGLSSYVGTVLLDLSDGGNSNKFSMNFEGTLQERTFIISSVHNMFIGCRFEQVPVGSCEFAAGSNQNMVIGGYGNYGDTSIFTHSSSGANTIFGSLGALVPVAHALGGAFDLRASTTTLVAQRWSSGVPGSVKIHAEMRGDGLLSFWTDKNVNSIPLMEYDPSGKLSFKKPAVDSTPTVQIDGVTHSVHWATGIAAGNAGTISAYNTGVLGLKGSWRYTVDNTYDIGLASQRPRYVRIATAVQTGAFATGSRPAAATAGVGAMVFDTTLGKPIWSTGAAWVDATGAVV